MVGQVFLTNDTMLNENEVALTGDWILKICCKGHLSQQDIIKEAFFLISLLKREFSWPD